MTITYKLNRQEVEEAILAHLDLKQDNVIRKQSIKSFNIGSDGFGNIFTISITTEDENFNSK